MISYLSSDSRCDLHQWRGKEELVCLINPRCSFGKHHLLIFALKKIMSGCLFLIPTEASEPQVGTNRWILLLLLLLLLNIPGTHRASFLSSLSARGSVGKQRRLPRQPLISPSSASASHLPRRACTSPGRSLGFVISGSNHHHRHRHQQPVSPHPAGWNQLTEMGMKSKRPIRRCVAEEGMKLETHLVSAAQTGGTLQV